MTATPNRQLTTRQFSAAALFCGALFAAPLLLAQQPASQPAPTVNPVLLADVASQPLDLASAAGVGYSSSSSLASVDPEAAGSLDLSLKTDAAQPPPRRRYGRPRYNDSSHNPDGSNKYAFVVGGGMGIPTGNTHRYLTPSYAFQVGAGRNLNKNFALMLQFDYDNFGFQGQTLFNQQSLYNYYCTSAQAALGNCTQVSGLDGNSHVWSFSLNPVYTLYSGPGIGAYVVAGVGFYHKTANFTVPTTGVYCDYYYGCYQYAANASIDKYTSNAPGFNGGFGLTFKPSRFANERLFVEGRYVFVDNSQRAGITAYSSTTTLNTYTGNNFYPANSNKTTYPVFKAGVRF